MILDFFSYNDKILMMLLPTITVGIFTLSAFADKYGDGLVDICRAYVGLGVFTIVFFIRGGLG